MLCLILLALVGARGARYSQAFDTPMVTNGTAMATLSDGARVDGSAVVANGELVLSVTGKMSQHGRFFVPALANSSLGWTASFSLRLTSSSSGADGVALVWGNTEAFVDPVVLYGSTAGNIGGNSSYRFMAWLIDTYGTLGGADSPGFYVVNSTGVRTTAASRAVTTLPTSRTVTATVTIGWNPQRGATFQTTGFATNANFVDLPFVHNASDAHSWMFIGDTGAVAELAAIDNIVIDAPCGECRSADNACVWNSGAQFVCATPAPFPTTACIWSSWSACSVACGTGANGSRTRTREATCASSTDSELCFGGCCPFDCVASAWSEWSACSVSCGAAGVQTRSRSIFFPCILRRVVFGRHKRVDLLQRCVHNHEPPYASAQSGADVRVTDICVSQWL
jgi:hypothetical protein